MKEKIKAYLEKHNKLKILAYLIAKGKDKSYIDTLARLGEVPSVVYYETKEAKEMPALCVIQVGGENDGFFACMRWVLDGLYFCDYFGFEPIIKFSAESLYKDDIMPSEVNPFNYYYTSTSRYNEHDISTHMSVKYCSWNGMMAERFNGNIRYGFSDTYINEMAQIMSKYLHYNDVTKDYIFRMLTDLQIDENTIGIHIRGTDYKGNYKNHPVYVSPDEYYPYIDMAMEKWGFNKIFLATDDQDFLQEFLKHYDTEKVCYLSDNTRGNGASGVHTQKKEGKYQLGLEVICDMCMLASCGGIVSSMSQVAMFARIYKRSQGEKYIYDKIISKGVNAKGKIFKV